MKILRDRSRTHHHESGQSNKWSDFSTGSQLDLEHLMIKTFSHTNGDQILIRKSLHGSPIQRIVVVTVTLNIERVVVLASVYCSSCSGHSSSANLY